jgi:hypothetical protein
MLLPTVAYSNARALLGYCNRTVFHSVLLLIHDTHDTHKTHKDHESDLASVRQTYGGRLPPLNSEAARQRLAFWIMTHSDVAKQELLARSRSYAGIQEAWDAAWQDTHAEKKIASPPPAPLGALGAADPDAEVLATMSALLYIASQTSKTDATIVTLLLDLMAGASCDGGWCGLPSGFRLPCQTAVQEAHAAVQRARAAATAAAAARETLALALASQPPSTADTAKAAAMQAITAAATALRDARLDIAQAATTLTHRLFQTCYWSRGVSEAFCRCKRWRAATLDACPTYSTIREGLWCQDVWTGYNTAAFGVMWRTGTLVGDVPIDMRPSYGQPGTAGKEDVLRQCVQAQVASMATSLQPHRTWQDLPLTERVFFATHTLTLGGVADVFTFVLELLEATSHYNSPTRP